MKADPGAYSVYCNDGFTLAELVVEAVSGLSFTDFLHTYLTDPAGLDDTFTPVDDVDFDRLALKVLGSLKDIDTLRASLIAISEDGIISEDERPAFQDILDALEKISTNAKALKLWAIKNIHIKEEDV